MLRRILTGWRTAASAVAMAGFLGVAAGCGGGAPSSHVAEPLVRGFSPFMSPINFNTRIQNPTFTDGNLVLSCDPSYQGKIVVYFNDDTVLDPASVFVGGVPSLGLDLSALEILQFQPGVGNIQLPLSNVTVEATRIICTPDPSVMPLPDGQYLIGVFANIRNTDGDRLTKGPVFHSFTVGMSDTVRPFVVTTDPVNNQIGVGAGVPPPPPPSGLPAESIADVRTAIFGATTPDMIIRFNEGIAAASVNVSNVNVVDAGSVLIPPPAIAPAPGFPKLKSEDDGETLPSNGHEVLWRADPLTGGFPFGTIVACSVAGLYNTNPALPLPPPDNPAPLRDLAGNYMLVTYNFQFQTVAPPDLPANPFPEFAIWWSAPDRIGALDVVNQAGLADQFNGVPFPLGVPRNVLPPFTDTVASAQNLPNFDPFEIIIDQRTSAALCHSFLYVQSPNSGQIIIVNTRTSLPVAIVNTPTPGGISGSFDPVDGANVLLVTNSSANTITIFDLSNVTPGNAFLNGPVFIQKVIPTGNTPRPITIEGSAGGLTVADWNRDAGQSIHQPPLILWADFTDGVFNTMLLGQDHASQRLTLGSNAAPNDIVMTPCFGPPAIPPILFAAISQGGLPGQGKVAYYVAGPGCSTGVQTGARPDTIVGDLSGFDGPDGLDETLAVGSGTFFVVAESGSTANRVTTLGLEVGANNLPRRITSFNAVGANPNSICHRAPWANPCIVPIGSPFCGHISAPCQYKGTEQDVVALQLVDGTLASGQNLFICARGAGQITVIDLVSGSRDFYSPIPIPGIRRVASVASQ
jgi:hypothetical protein